MGCCSFTQVCSVGPAEELSRFLPLCSWHLTAVVLWDKPSLSCPRVPLFPFLSDWPVCPLYKISNKSRNSAVKPSFMAVVWNAASRVNYSTTPKTETLLSYHPAYPRSNVF